VAVLAAAEAEDQEEGEADDEVDDQRGDKVGRADILHVAVERAAALPHPARLQQDVGIARGLGCAV
jgi:hypothetical protein